MQLSHLQVEFRRRYVGLFEGASELLFRFDPAGLNFGSNVDEYEGKVERILQRLPRCRSAEDVDMLLREVFSPALLGRAPHLTGVSVALWQLWLDSHLIPPTPPGPPA